MIGSFLLHDVDCFDLPKKLREKESLTQRPRSANRCIKTLVVGEFAAVHRWVAHGGLSCLKLKTAEVLGSDMFLKVAEKAKREREERLQKETEIKRLKEEYAEMIERKQEVERQVQTHTVYWDFMEPVVKITKFEDVQVPMGHLKSCLHLRDQFCQSESEVQENQKRKALLTLKDQHHLLRLHKNNQLSQLQTGLEKSRSEALIWVPDIILSQSPTSELRPDQMLLKDSTTILCENQLPLSSYRKTKKESTPTGTDYDGDPCCFKTEFTVNSLN